MEQYYTEKRQIAEAAERYVSGLEEENKQLRKENTKLKAEQVCHNDQCKLDEISRLRELLEEAQEEIQNCYGRDIELTERIWEALEGGGE